MRIVSSIVPLAAVTILAAAAACGPGEGAQGGGPQTPSTSTAPSASTSAPPTAPSATPSGSASTATSTAPPIVMKPLTASSMDAKLREIGLDPGALPPLNKLDPKQLRDVMNTFTKSLGVRCDHCHEKDFKAPTRNKTIATHMWNDFTRGLAMDKGGALFCDSCHQGHDKVLARTDLKALGAWMQDNFVDKLKRADKKDHGCDTCHGDPFEGKILASWK